MLIGHHTILKNTASKYLMTALVWSFTALLIINYCLLFFYAVQQRNLASTTFIRDTIHHINQRISTNSLHLNQPNLAKPTAIQSYQLTIFEPSGKTIAISSELNQETTLPNWAVSSLPDNVIYSSSHGIETWQTLNQNYKLYLKIRYKSLLYSFANPIYLLPLLIALCIYFICSIKIHKRYQVWADVIDYTQNIQSSIHQDYVPLVLPKRYTNPELLHLSHIINRNTFQLHQNVRKIKELSKHQQILIDNAPLALFLINRKGQLTYFNQQFSQLFNTSFNPASVYMLNDFVTGLDKLTQQTLTNIQENLHSNDIVVTNLQHNMYFAMRLNPFYNRFGHIDGYSGCLEMVTNYHEQIQTAWFEQRKNTDRMASVDKLWAVLGHELRTPLSGMIGMIDLLALDKDEFSDEQQETLETLQQSSQTMLQLLNDMLDVAKMEAGKLQTHFVMVDITQLLKQTSELMTGNARKRNINLEIYIDPNTPRNIETDDGRLRQILLNLVSNAIKFTKQGYVAMIVEPVMPEDPIIRKKRPNNDQPNWLKLTVKDTGIGISQQEQKKLFSFFNQANDSISHQFGGTGLGLAISNNFSQLLGGFIHLESETGMGSEFQVYLPLVNLNYKPVFSFNMENLPVYLVMIVEFDISKYYWSKVFDSLNVPYTIVTKINDKIIADINQINYHNLMPIFLVDDKIYKNQSTFFIDIPAFQSSAKIVLSMDSERTIDSDILADFDSLIQKPIMVSTLIAEINRTYQRNLNPQNQQKPLSAQDAFKLFLQKLGTHHQTTTHQSVKKSILLAEDNLVNQKIAQKILEGMGYHIIIANNGEEALQLLEQHRQQISLILMDCRMPIMDGLEATRKIRAKQDSIAIIALTANNSDEDRQECINAGMDNFLTKPLNKTQLLELTNRYML